MDINPGFENFKEDSDISSILPFIRTVSEDEESLIPIEPKKSIIIGTDTSCDIVLPFGKKIFPKHASLESDSGRTTLSRLFDHAHIMINDRQLQKSQILFDRDVIVFGDVIFEYFDPRSKNSNEDGKVSKENAVNHISNIPVTKKMDKAIPEHIPTGDSITIGRDPSNTIVLSHEMVSRFHAKIEYQNNDYHIIDLHSTNGTYLNGMVISDSVIKPDDIIQIGDFEFHFDGRTLKIASHEGEAKLDAMNLKRTINNNTIILNNISFSIYPRELVAIVGGSGAGKSTLMNALGGFSPADEGTVFINGIDFYKYFDAFRSTLGYVPQDDIIHKELSVFKALYYAACLRMPEDTRSEERKARIEQVLMDLQLTHRKKTEIWQLSGGERKRVSIGVELLTRPRLFFLDEPTSGLDPGLESDMMNIFRLLANQGHTTVLITHATKNLHLCDQVIFLARGGYLAYFGPPRDALQYFEAEDFTDIYIKLERDKRPDLWARQFRNSVEYKKYVQSRLDETNPKSRIDEQKNDRQKKKTGGGRTSALRQYLILTKRYIEIIGRDTKNLAILLLQAPLIGVLLSIVYGRDIFDMALGNYGEAKSLIFFIICISIWFGTSNAAREIAKEIPVYKRERFINLGISPYIFSKTAVLIILCTVQSLILLLIIFTKVKIPNPSLYKYLNILLIVLCTSIGAMVMGLTISAIVNNPDKAGSIVPILLIPQIVFSGAIIKLKGIADVISYFTLSRWGFELLGKVTEVSNAPLVTTPVLKKSSEGIFNIIDVNHYSILIGYILLFLLLTCLFQKLKDYSRER